MLSIEIIEEMRREEERRREGERPELRIPVDQPLEPMPDPEKASDEESQGGTVITVDMSHDDAKEFTIATW